MRTICVLSLACCFFAARPIVRAVDPLGDPGGIRAAEVLKADADFSRMSAEQGAEKAFDHFLMIDALEAIAEMDRVAIKSDVLTRMRNIDAKGLVLTWHPYDGEVALSNDLGFTFGRWELRKKQGNSLVSRGYYATAWRKVKGEWKAKFDMGNDSPLEAK